MAITLQEIVFDGRAPQASAIAAKVEEILALPLVVDESEAEIAGTLYDLCAPLAFERFPKCKVRVTAYRSGAVAEHIRRTGIERFPDCQGSARCK